MRRWLPLVLLVVAAARGSTTLYSVEPVDCAGSQLVTYAMQEFRATSDSVSGGAVFLGAPESTGNWVFTVFAGPGHMKTLWVAAADSWQSRFVPFSFSPALGVQKGALCTLMVSHSSGSP